MSKNRHKRSKFWRPKGRALDPQAVSEIDTLFDGEKPRRELLIEFLHRIQDQYGCLYRAHLHALAEWMGIAPVEVFEVASFYHHFEVVDGVEDAPPELTIRVCDSISCMLAGAEKLIEALELNCASDEVRIQRVPCVGRCDTAPVAVIGEQPLACASPQRVEQALAVGEHHYPSLPAALQTYLKEGGYAFYRSCLGNFGGR